MHVKQTNITGCPGCPLHCVHALNFVHYARETKAEICGVGNKLIIQLQTHHTVSLVSYASSAYLLGSSWGIAIRQVGLFSHYYYFVTYLLMDWY